MSVMSAVQATVTPTGETRIVPPGKVYVYVGGQVFEVEAILRERASSPTERPQRVLFGAIRDPKVRIKNPIPVDISVEDGSVVAFSPLLREFGYGPSLSEALDDFGKTVCELYHSLESQESRLSEDLTNTLSNLRTYIEPRRIQR